MKFKLNPLTGEFDYTSDSANKEKLNPMTGEFNLVEGDGPFSQIFNPLTGTFNLSSGGGGIIQVVLGNGYVDLTDAVANQLKYLKLFGGIEQDLTPTPDTPVDIVSNNGVLKFSKNMANVNTQTALVGYYISTSGQVLESPYNRIYQEFIPCKPSTKYTLSISSAVFYVTISEYVSASDSGFYRRNAGSSGGNTKLTIMTGANTTYLRFGANLSSSNITIDDVLAIDWQLEIGDTPTPYHEYVEGGVYVDGTVETISNRINLFDINKVTDGYYYTTQGQYEATEAARLTDFIPVQAGKTYVFKYIAAGGPNVRLNYFDTNKNWLSQTITSSTSGTYSYNITPSQDGYVRISANRPNVGSQSYIDWDNTVIETYGDTATAEMLLAIGDTEDVQEVISGHITRNIGIKVLDGTENWQFATQLLNYMYSLQVNDMFAETSSVTSNRQSPYCTHFERSTNWISGQAARQNKIQAYTDSQSNTYLGLGYGTPSSANLNSFKQRLAAQYNAGTPVIIVYPLKTPATESVTGQTLHIQAGSNTIEITQASIDNLPLEAKYLQSN